MELPPVKIVERDPVVVAGIVAEMSHQNHDPVTIWSSFRKLLAAEKVFPNEYFSLQEYPVDFFSNYLPTRTFKKWAAAYLDDQFIAKHDLASLNVGGGTYAAFHYRGPASGAPALFRQIYTSWLPASGYQLDDRPHFEILGPAYDRSSNASEEMIYIPVKPV